MDVAPRQTEALQRADAVKQWCWAAGKVGEHGGSAEKNPCAASGVAGPYGILSDMEWNADIAVKRMGKGKADSGRSLCKGGKRSGCFFSAVRRI